LHNGCELHPVHSCAQIREMYDESTTYSPGCDVYIFALGRTSITGKPFPYGGYSSQGLNPRIHTGSAPADRAAASPDGLLDGGEQLFIRKRKIQEIILVYQGDRLEDCNRFLPAGLSLVILWYQCDRTVSPHRDIPASCLVPESPYDILCFHSMSLLLPGTGY